MVSRYREFTTRLNPSLFKLLVKRLHLLLPLLILSIFSFTSCRSDYQSFAKQGKSEGKKPQEEPRAVKVTRIAEMPIGETVIVNGTLAAYDQATVSAKVPGRLQSISVDLGSHVRRGQIVARIDPQDYLIRVQQAEAAIAQARARLGLTPEGSNDTVDSEQTGTVRQARALLDEAKLTRQRAASLIEEGVIARAEYDAANAAYKVAQSRYQDAIEEIHNRRAVLAQRRSELALAKQQLADTSIYAPFDGMVEQKSASLGEYIAAGAPVINIVKIDPLRFRAEVPERDAKDLRVGQPISVSVEGLERNYAGRVTRISPVITEQNRVLVIEADISNDGNLRPGSFARANIVTNDATMATTVPANAIVTFAGIEKVITVDNGKALEKPVTTKRRSGELVEVIDGVNVGDMVVVDPGNLQTGQPVKVME
jgi:RND family efflux transporter MFP subunit